MLAFGVFVVVIDVFGYIEPNFFFLFSKHLTELKICQE